MRADTLNVGYKSQHGEMAVATSNPGYDNQYAQEARSAPAMEGGAAPPAPMAPGAPGGSVDGQQYSPDSYAKSSLSVERWFSPAAYAQDTAADQQYLIRNGDMTVFIENYDTASTKAQELAAKYRGVVTDSNMQKNYDGTRSGFVTLRVPAKEFMAAWAELAKLGEVENQNVTTQDVSQEYVSAVSRMQNLLAEQKTLQGMLDDAREVQRTRGLGDAYKVLLDTQARLSDVTGELRGIEDQVAQLADKITRSTIRVNLSEKKAYQPDEFTWGFGDTAKSGWKDVVLGVKNFLNGVIYVLVTVPLWLPWVALIALPVWVIYRRTRKRAKPAPKPLPDAADAS